MLSLQIECPHLSVFVLYGACEHVSVRESLRARALSHRDHARLRGVQYAALLAHRLGVRHRCAEVTLPRDTPCNVAGFKELATLVETSLVFITLPYSVYNISKRSMKCTIKKKKNWRLSLPSYL